MTVFPRLSCMDLYGAAGFTFTKEEQEGNPLIDTANNNNNNNIYPRLVPTHKEIDRDWVQQQWTDQRNRNRQTLKQHQTQTPIHQPPTSTSTLLDMSTPPPLSNYSHPKTSSSNATTSTPPIHHHTHTATTELYTNKDFRPSEHHSSPSQLGNSFTAISILETTNRRLGKTPPEQPPSPPPHARILLQPDSWNDVPHMTTAEKEQEEDSYRSCGSDPHTFEAFDMD